jgi:hypothetical protein
MIADLSQYVLKVLRTDEEFVLYRGAHSNHSPSILLLAPPAGSLSRWLSLSPRQRRPKRKLVRKKH